MAVAPNDIPELFSYELIGVSAGNKNQRILSSVEYLFGLYEMTFSLPIIGQYSGILRLLQNGGLIATYYKTIDFQAPVYLKSVYDHAPAHTYTKLEKTINFRFDESEPMLTPNYPTEFFAVKWEGKLKAPSSETYRLFIEVHNTSMVELSLNGQRRVIYNDFNGVGTTEGMYADVEFIAGQFYDIELRYAHKIGPHKLILSWESDTRDLDVIGEEWFYQMLSSDTARNPYILQVIPDITNATTTALTPASQLDHQHAIVGVKETQFIHARDKWGNM